MSDRIWVGQERTTCASTASSLHVWRAKARCVLSDQAITSCEGQGERSVGFSPCALVPFASVMEMIGREPLVTFTRGVVVHDPFSALRMEAAAEGVLPGQLVSEVWTVRDFIIEAPLLPRVGEAE